MAGPWLYPISAGAGRSLPSRTAGLSRLPWTPIVGWLRMDGSYRTVIGTSASTGIMSRSGMSCSFTLAMKIGALSGLPQLMVWNSGMVVGASVLGSTWADAGFC